MRLADRGVPVVRVLKAMRLLDQSCLNMCEGQHMDLAFQERLDVSTDSYFKMAEGKAGALIEICLFCHGKFILYSCCPCLRWQKYKPIQSVA